MLKILISFILYCLIFSNFNLFSQEIVTVIIDGASEKKPISPYIYGKNNCLSDAKNNPLSTARWQFLRDAGIRMFRENGGNNATKYNWRLKLSSHPDWYNNVYKHDWDYAAQSLQQNIPSAQGMWAFQLVGKVAKTTSQNFNDWSYNGSQWWDGVGQNLAGGGTVNPAGGGNALVEGNPELYLEDWPADSTVGILNHWFGEDGIGLDTNRIRYWNMDNEPEIWDGTHDDVWPVQPSAEEFMQIYFEVTKKARAEFPGIKLMGPVPCNEWQWYNWKGSKVSYKGKEYVWLEYFILRIAEEQALTGIRLLDVLDIHYYPGETNAADIVQLHRVYFDTTFNYPGANGVKRSGSGGWDNSITKEYIFERCRRWLEQYMGPDHGVTFSVSETGINTTNPNVTACWYASTLGEFAKQGVEIYTPWGWETGMYEVIHLFSRYGKESFIEGKSYQEEFVSAYPTINSANDSMTVFLVNRHTTATKQIELNIKNFYIKRGAYKMYSLSSLPQSETFISHQNNALKVSEIEVSGNKVNISLPPLSVSAVLIKRSADPYAQFGDIVAEAEAEDGVLTGVTVGSSNPGYSGTGYVTGFDNSGDKVTVSINVPETDYYRLVIQYNGPNGDKYQNLIINNGSSSPVSFPATDSFTFIQAGSYLLEQGINTFTISKNWGWTDIDKFLLFVATKNTYDISPTLVDSSATEAARALYNMLLLQFGDRIISGQSHDTYDQVKNLTGKSPLIRNADFNRFTEGYPYLWKDGGHTFGIDDDGSVNQLINWYNSTGKKGIVAYQWHWCSPSGGSAGTNTFYTDYTTFDITRAVTPGTQEYSDIIRDIDTIAYQLKKYQDAGIPVLWRPLHEAGGGWFWWGAKGPEACKALYNIMFDRLKNYHQLHNLIWVWSTPESDWYPGNDKVDIIGHDSYPGEYNYGHQKYAFDVLYRLTSGKKLIAMTENGPIPDPDACLELDAPWSYFMSWSNLVFDQNSDDHIIDVFNNPNVLTVESNNFKTSNEWRSSLYPENWKPGFKDNQGRFLHDFSYAGYHNGEKEIPYITANIVDVTLPPYNADNTGVADVTTIIQQALDDVGSAGGGIVYLPTGTFRIKTPSGSDYGLHIKYDSTILRGAGPDSTFLFHDETYMRKKDIIHVRSEWSDWFSPNGTTTDITVDLTNPTRIIPVTSVSGFNVGDNIIISSSPTDEWIEEHKMTGIWTASAIHGVAFMRQIDSIDAVRNLLIIDVPTRYFLKTRDNSRVYHANKHISECGIENLSIGNRENPKTGWDEESYSTNGTGAWDVHFSQVIQFKYSQNCWVRNVHTYKPAVNSDDVHILSNCLILSYCRNITIDSCFFQKPQYEGGGGNGYMYTLSSNDCLIKNSIANHGRHNYDFKYPYSNGNVIHNCLAENSKYSSDFHMYLSMANLFDVCESNGDYFESSFRPYGGDAIHGYTSTQSVFYNLKGTAYNPDRDYLIESRQFGWGYIIGTSGPAYEVFINPVAGTSDGYSFDTSPRDFTEGIGDGDNLRPWSLYQDQLYRRLKDSSVIHNYNVEIVVRDAETFELVPGCTVTIYKENRITNASGSASFNDIPESFILKVEKDLAFQLGPKQTVIYSDTTITVYLTSKIFDITIKLMDKNTLDEFWGVDVTLGTETKVTDDQGEVTFTVYEGNYEYLIDKLSYLQEAGTLEITSDTTINFYLTQILAYIKFWLKEGDAAPVNNAIVRINGDSLVTTSLGLAHFRQLPVSVNYDYRISKTGYYEETGELYLTRDTSLYITMEPWLSNTELFPDGKSVKLWPNPVRDFLYCTVPDICSEQILRITDLIGTEVFNQKVDEKSFNINICNLPQGVYILSLYSSELQTTRLFVKE
jgi:hypothetical protein